MATSGTLGKLTGLWKTTYTVTWSLLSQSIADNTSKIRLTATLYTGNSTTISASNSNFVLDGTTVFSGYYSKSGAGNIFVETKDITVKHNTDGSFPTRNVSFSASDGYIFNPAQSGSGNITGVPSIPRYANVTQSSYDITETGLRINWTTDSTVDFIWYSTNDGSSWVPVGSVNGKNGNFEITGLSPNTLYNVRTRVKRKDSQLESNSSRLQITTYDYPYCIESPDFTVGQLLTLKLYNPLSRLVEVTFIGANNQELSTDSTAMDIVEGYNSETFVKKLYNSIPNSGASPYKIKVTYGDSVKIRDNNNTYNVDGNECTPIFNNFTYKDNSSVVDITGNNQVLVKGLSNVQVTISSANKMVALNSASPNKYTATIDGLSASANYSDNDVVIDVGTVTSAGIKRLSVIAYDSRYCRKTVDKDIMVYDYIKPVVNLEVARLNNFEDQTTLKINGTYDQLLIDNESKNAIELVQYRYRESGENNEWSNWITVNTTISNGNFTCNEVILSLDNTKAFEIEVQAIDKLDSNIATGSIDVGEAIFFISSNRKACYINGKKILMYEDVNETNKSIKLEDSYLWDSESVIHNGETLKNVIANLSGNGGQNSDINRTDLNSFTDELIIAYGHNLINSPLDNLNQGHLISIPRHDQTGFVTQYFSPYPSNDVYIRKCENGTWGKWYLITNNYSRSERLVGTWIDGKPIYRIVKQVTKVSGSNLDIPLGDLNIDVMVNLKARINSNAGVQYADLPRYENSNNFVKILYYKEYNKAMIISGSESYCNGVVEVTFEYTKTTD